MQLMHVHIMVHLEPIIVHLRVTSHAFHKVEYVASMHKQKS